MLLRYVANILMRDPIITQVLKISICVHVFDSDQSGYSWDMVTTCWGSAISLSIISHQLQNHAVTMSLCNRVELPGGNSSVVHIGDGTIVSKVSDYGNPRFIWRSGSFK